MECQAFRCFWNSFQLLGIYTQLFKLSGNGTWPICQCLQVFLKTCQRCTFIRLTVLCKMKRNEMKICSLWNENLYFAKWKSLLCEMKICSLQNENRWRYLTSSLHLNRKLSAIKRLAIFRVRNAKIFGKFGWHEEGWRFYCQKYANTLTAKAISKTGNGEQERESLKRGSFKSGNMANADTVF